MFGPFKTIMLNFIDSKRHGEREHIPACMREKNNFILYDQ